jgi:hypothetical protein
MLDRTLRFTLPAASAALVACGGLASSSVRGADASDRTIPTNEASSDSGPDFDVVDATDDAAGASCPGCDANDAPIVFPGCPPIPPTVGDSCSADAEVCEYGPSWWLACNAVMRCTKGTWQAEPRGGFAPCGDLEAGGACPATWAEASAIEAGTLCPSADCQYPEGYCECLNHCGGGGAMRGTLSGTWECQAATPRCPSPRPRLGTSCDGVDSGLCNYGWPCGCGQDQSCQGGVWQGYPSPPCP